MKFESNKDLIKECILFFISFFWFFYLFSFFFDNYSIDDTGYIEYTNKTFEKIELKSSIEEKKILIDDEIEKKKNSNIEKRKNDALVRYKEYVEKQKQLIENYDIKDIVKYELNPESFFVYDKWKNIILVLSSIMKSKIFLNDIDLIVISLYKNSFEVRWKYKDKNIFLFDLERLSIEEIVNVFVHEYGHFFDLILLSPKYRQDFYNISWEDTKVLKAWIKNTSFVSWYAMTNRYEDFAESFLYFVMHNKSFKKKAWKDILLQKKYDFFRKYVFKNGEFKDSLFAKDEDLKDYYRDITKIDINLKNFFEYLKKWI